MDPILAQFEAEVARFRRNKPQIPIVSSLYGRLATDEELTNPGYWAAQLRHTVRFADAVGTLLHDPSLALLEVGPGQTLTTLARQNPAKQPAQASVYSSPRTCKESETLEFLNAVGQLWLAGVEIDWNALSWQYLAPPRGAADVSVRAQTALGRAVSPDRFAWHVHQRRRRRAGHERRDFRRDGCAQPRLKCDANHRRAVWRAGGAHPGTIANHGPTDRSTERGFGRFEPTGRSRP